MRTDRAYVGCLLADDDMTAVGALPYSVAFLGEYKLVLYVGQKLSVSFFVFLFDSCYAFEQNCDVFKAFFSCRFSKPCVHIRPLIVFTKSSVQQVFSRRRDRTAVQKLIPNFCVFLFVLCGFFKQCCDLHVAFLSCLGSEIGVLVSCLRFTCESFLQVCFRLAALQGVNRFKYIRLLALRAAVNCAFAFVNVTTYFAYILHNFYLDTFYFVSLLKLILNRIKFH